MNVLDIQELRVEHLSARVLMVGHSSEHSARLLADSDLTVDWCLSGRQVLGKLRQNSYEVVLCDLNMGGIELMTRVHERFPEVAFVMVIEPENLRNGILAMMSGASDYILTPLQPDTIVLSLNRALERRRIESALGEYQRKLDLGQSWAKQR